MRDDSGLYRQVWCDDGRNTENGSHVPPFVVVAPDAPRITVFCLGVSHIEHLNIALPGNLFVKSLGYWCCDDVRSVEAVNGLNRLAQFRKVVAHGLESATKSSTFHKREETPSAIAGVQRIVECTFTKL